LTHLTPDKRAGAQLENTCSYYELVLFKNCYGLSILPERADVKVILLGVTLEITGVALLLDALIFNRPMSCAQGEAGEQPLEDLTCTFHVLEPENLAVISAAPLLPGLRLTLAPLFLRDLATRFS
jgi:hypothetical protein